MNGNRCYELFFEDTALGLRHLFWWFDDSHDDWRLYVVSKYCDDHGQRATYLRLRKHLEKAGLRESLPLHRIVVARTDNPVVNLVMRGKGDFYLYARQLMPGLRVFDSGVGVPLPTTSASKPFDMKFQPKASVK